MSTITAAGVERLTALSRTEGGRTPHECVELGRLMGRLSAVPRLAPSELLRLATDATFIHPSSLSLLFLQGDFGNCFYIIVSGSVGLYVNKSTER